MICRPFFNESTISSRDGIFRRKFVGRHNAACNGSDGSIAVRWDLRRLRLFSPSFIARRKKEKDREIETTMRSVAASTEWPWASSRCSSRSLVDDGWGQLLHRCRCQEYLSDGHPFFPPFPPPSLPPSFSKRHYSLLPGVRRFPRALSFPFILSATTNIFSFRVAHRILLSLWRSSLTWFITMHA